jgi:hypothetical protein
MKLKTIALCITAAAVVGILAGCATSSGAPGEANPDSPSDLPADTAVVRVEQTGGFVTAQTNFSRVPTLAVYADGRAITEGAQIKIFPPPALSSLQVAQLSEAQVERIVDLADDAGLLVNGIEYGEPGISDATTTVVTIVSGGTTYVHEAYALAGAGSDLGDGGLPGLDEAANEARATLTSFITEATEIAGSSEAEIWEPAAYGLQATPAVAPVTEDPDGTDDIEGVNGTDGTAGTEGMEDDLLEPALPWELADVDLAAAATCIPIEGDTAVELREQFAAANTLTRFDQAGVEYEVWIRPVFPDETACTVAE